MNHQRAGESARPEVRALASRKAWWRKRKEGEADLDDQGVVDGDVEEGRRGKQGLE